MKEIIKKEKRRGMKIKRMLSVVLTLAMVFSLIPMNSMTVYATTPSDIALGTPSFNAEKTECTVPVTVTGSVKTLSVSVTNAKMKLTNISGTGYTFKNAVVSSSLCDSTPSANKEYLSVQLVVDNATAAQTALAEIKYCSITSGAEVKISADTVSLADGDYFINGHYYTVKDDVEMSWVDAMKWAFNLQSNSTYSAKYPGYKSYPVVITSEEENQMLVNVWNNNGGQKRQVFLPAVPVSPDGGSISVNGTEGNRTVTVTNTPKCSGVSTTSFGRGDLWKWIAGTPEGDAGKTLPKEDTVGQYTYGKYWTANNPTDGGLVYFGFPGAGASYPGGAYWDDLTDDQWTVTKTYNDTWHFCAVAEWEPTDSVQMIVKTKALEQHTHTWSYSVGEGTDSNKLTATCTCAKGTSGCSYKDLDAGVEGRKVTLTFTATSPDTGTASTITVGTSDEQTAWTGAGLTVPTTISYAKSDGTPLVSAPTTAGSYVAKVSPAGENATDSNTAKVSFSISKVDPTATAPTAVSSLTYDGNEHALVTAGSTSDGTLKYKLESSGTYSTVIPKATSAGTYNVYYKVFGDDNHLDKEFGPISVTIDPADCTIFYNTNGGSTVPNATHQSTIAFPSSAPTKSGYNFAGWYLDSACTNKAVEGTALSSNTTLYAKWTAVPKQDDSGSNPDPEPSTPSSPSTLTYIPPAATEPTTPVTPPTYVAPEKEVVISIPVATPGGVIKNVSVHKDGTVQEASPVPPARIVTYNEVCNPAAPTAVTAVNILVDKVSAETTAKVEDVTAEVNVKTIQGNINVSPKLVSGLKEEAVSSVGKKVAKNLDIKINTTAANGKAVIATLSAAALKNNAVLDAYIIDPVTGSYVFTNAPSAKYNKKTGLTITGLIGGFEYVYVPESEAKKIDQYIMNTVKVSDEFAKPVQSVPGASIDMTKALSSGLCLANIQKVEYAVSGNRATINPLTGQLAINPNAKKGTITVTMKITLMNGKTKTLKTRIKI